jgi:anti-sigma factor RsiW
MKNVLGHRSELNRDQADELLSAYLDGMLEPQEQERLEVRLGREPELRKQLEGLRLTVRALGDLPRVEPPRNFILSPAMVRERKPVRPKRKPRTWPIFGWATAVAALLFVLVFGGDVFLVSPTVRNEPANIVAKAPASEEARAEPRSGEREAAPETEAPVMRQEAPKEAAPTNEGLQAVPPEETATSGEAAALGAAEAATEVAEATAEAERLPAASMPVGGGGVTPTPAGTPMIEAAEAAPVESPAPEGVEEPEATVTEPVAMMQVPDETTGAVPEPEAEMAPSPQAVAAAQAEEAAAESEAQAPAEEVLPWLRLLEVGLGLSAVVLLLVTLVLRWRRV